MGAPPSPALPHRGPKVVWTHPLGKGFAAAAIRDGEAYVLDRVKSREDVLRCYDIQTGKELWTYSHEDRGKVSFNGSRAAPTVDREHVYCVGMLGQSTA